MPLPVEIEHQAPRASSELAARFEQMHSVTGAGALRGGGAAGPAGADDGDAQGRRHAETQVFHAIQSLRSGVSAMRWCST